MNDTSIFLAKALESLQGAESELATKRFNNVANRAYYAAFQAAVAAMIAAGIRPQHEGGGLSHRHVQNTFSGLLVYRRKRSKTMAIERARVPKARDIQPYIQQLQALVSSKYPDATFDSPWYLADDEVWILESNIPVDDDPALSAQLSDIETTILNNPGLCLCVVL